MKLADMELRLESARLLTWKAAMLKDVGQPYTKVLAFSANEDSDDDGTFKYYCNKAEAENKNLDCVLATVEYHLKKKLGN